MAGSAAGNTAPHRCALLAQLYLRCECGTVRRMGRPSMADTPAEVGAIFRSLPDRLRDEHSPGRSGLFHFVLTGAHEPDWTVRLEETGCEVSSGLHGEADCAVRMSEETFLSIETGKRDPVTAFVSGKVRITNIGRLRRYDAAFYKFHDQP